MTSNTTNLGASTPLPEGGKSLRIPSGPPPASRLAREPASVIIRLAGQAPSRRCPLSSNVRQTVRASPLEPTWHIEPGALESQKIERRAERGELPAALASSSKKKARVLSERDLCRICQPSFKVSQWCLRLRKVCALGHGSAGAGFAEYGHARAPAFFSFGVQGRSVSAITISAA